MGLFFSSPTDDEFPVQTPIYANYQTFTSSKLVIRGNHNFVYGSQCRVTGDGNIIEGAYCTVLGDFNELRGRNSRATGEYNFLIGHNCTARGYHGSTDRAIANGLGLNIPMGEERAQINPPSGTITMRGGQGEYTITNRDRFVKGPAASERDAHDHEASDDGASVCVVCQTKTKIVVALPCGHLSSCVDCSINLCGSDGNAKEIGQVQCLLCRQNVHEMKRIYL